MRLKECAFLSICAALLAAGDAGAAITGARATPRQANVVGSGSTLVSVSWQVSTTPEHRSGVTSVASNIIDPASGVVLQGARAPLAATGAGPFLLRESIALDAASVRSWAERGIRRVLLERTFADPGTGTFASATVVLVLSSSRLEATRDAAPAQLSIVSLRVEFDTGNDTAVTEAGEPLRASLTVQHSGSGMLAGRWQIAEPESSDGAPLFRTLALVNMNLQATQRSVLRSPALPTTRGGKYVVRFCASSRDEVTDVIDVIGDMQCPDAELVAMATYQVRGRLDDAIGIIGRLSPDRQAVTQSSAFSWQPVSNAAVYQLQIFELAPADAERVPQGEEGSAEPRFVTGMLVGRQTVDTPLSELVRSKLVSGQRYLWRVTAHDETGRRVGASAEASFVYRPGG